MPANTLSHAGPNQFRGFRAIAVAASVGALLAAGACGTGGEASAPMDTPAPPVTAAPNLLPADSAQSCEAMVPSWVDGPAVDSKVALCMNARQLVQDFVAGREVTIEPVETRAVDGNCNISVDVLVSDQVVAVTPRHQTGQGRVVAEYATRPGGQPDYSQLHAVDVVHADVAKPKYGDEFFLASNIYYQREDDGTCKTPWRMHASVGGVNISKLTGQVFRADGSRQQASAEDVNAAFAAVRPLIQVS